MTTKLKIPTRQVVLDDQKFAVPRGIGRNNRNRSWQVKIVRNGETVLSGNFADDLYEGPQGSLDAAIAHVAASDVAQETRHSLQLNDRVTLSWAEVGLGVIGLIATVYNPAARKGTTVYLISQGKLASGKVEGLSEKITRALERAWKQENDRQSVPMVELLRMRNEVDVLLASDRFAELSVNAPEKKVKGQ